MASLDAKTLDSLRGYLDVAYRLGLLLAAVATQRAGDAASSPIAARWPARDTKLLTAAFCRRPAASGRSKKK